MDKTKLQNSCELLIKVIAIVFACYSLILPSFATNLLAARSLHLAFVFALIILESINANLKKEKPSKLLNIVLIAGVAVIVGACLYLWYFSNDLLLYRVGIYNDKDIIAGLIVFFAVMIATQRKYGWLLTGIITFFVVYLFAGPYLPAIIGHPGVSFRRIVGNIALGTEGIFGSPLGAAVNTVAIFVVFASFLEESGGFSVFMDLSMALFGKINGGAAKVAVVSSSLFGTISGSAAANVAGTGMITIPTMKRCGYEPHVAGAVEAASSSGGQLMPPVMGAAAFVMAEMLSLPYTEIMVAGVVPAICYYVAIFFSVDLYSRKHGIGDASAEFSFTDEQRKNIYKRGILLLPLVILFICVGVLYWSAAKAAMWSTVAILLCAMPYKEHRFNLKKILNAMAEGGKAVLSISIICAASGIIIGVFTVTGLGLKLSSAIVALSGGHLIVLLFLAMISSLILGMGVPTVAAYLILAILVAPAMVEFGVPAICAHMFVFYFGIISAITPPVALAAYVGAGIAGSQPVKVGFTACGLALPAFIVPYILAYNPALILQGDSMLATAQVVISTVFGSFLCCMIVQGYFCRNLSKVERLIFAIAAICVMIPESITDYVGFAIAIPTMYFIYRSAKKAKTPTAVE
ncbi:MAG: TRAP transporter fused permease subunit [Oscillospiraceae bacterium]|nr:TRAP transporter fused permease subunit [Oscillospiraceae bacterium]